MKEDKKYILIGGSGYIGAHLIHALIHEDKVHPGSIHVVDPVKPAYQPGGIHWLQDTGGNAHALCDIHEDDRVWWLAGPRNTGTPAYVQTVGAMIEREWDRFLGACQDGPCPYITLVSSMSIWDYPENTYQQHKKRMENRGGMLPEVRCVRPGTVVGTWSPVNVLRGDLGVHAALLKGGFFNLGVFRAYVLIQDLINELRKELPECDLVEAYTSAASMSMLFKYVPGIAAKWCEPAFFIDKGPVRVTADGIERLAQAVRDLALYIRKGPEVKVV